MKNNEKKTIAVWNRIISKERNKNKKNIYWETESYPKECCFSYLPQKKTNKTKGNISTSSGVRHVRIKIYFYKTTSLMKNKNNLRVITTE